MSENRIAAAATVALSALCACGLEVGPFDVGTIDVPTDMTQASVVSIGPGACLYKTGAGTWVLPTELIGWEPSSAISVRQGMLELDYDSTPSSDVACPTAVLNAKALLWFDASVAATKPELFATRSAGGKTFVDTLYDARETDTANRTRPCAVAEHVFRYVKPGMADGVQGNCATSNNAVKILSPELVTHCAKDALWFGGVGSGRRMVVHRAGKSDRVGTEDVVHMFLVTDVTDGWGNALDGFASSGIWWGSAYQSLRNATLSIDAASWLLGNRTYVNGVRIDPLTAVPQKGFQLFECEVTAAKRIASRLFYCASGGDGGSCKIAADDDGSRATAVQLGGGDYVYELIAFTNRLTGVERQQVAEYLRRKWMSRPATALELGFASGAKLGVKSETAAESPLARGVCAETVKKGHGAMTVVRDKENPALNYGAIDVQGGSVAFKAPAPVKAAAGSRVDAAYTGEAICVTCEADATDGDALVKGGNGDALLRGIPDGVKRIDVAAGRLVVHPVGAGAADVLDDAGEYVNIPNASFEDWSGSGKEGKWGNDFWTTWPGWQLLDGTESKAGGVIYNIDNWGLDAAGMDGATRSAWALTARPHDGACALVLRGVQSAERGVMTKTALDLKAGRYELEYWSNGRGSSTGALLDIELIEETTRVHTIVGRQVQMYTTSDGFGPVRMRFDLETAGRYYLGFHSRAGADYGDRLTVVDDIKLRRISSNAGRWPIPGGNMEQVNHPNVGRMTSRTFSTEITHDKWTLVQPAGAESATGMNLGVGFANRYMQDYGSGTSGYYNDSAYPQLTTMMTFFTNGACARTTFTPPAGTWRLQARMAENGQTPTHGLTATATVGGKTVTLGKVDPDTKIFKEFTFSGDVLAVDGNTEVTLTLAYSLTANVFSGAKRATLFVDDLALVKDGYAKSGCTLIGRLDGDTNRTLDWYPSPLNGSDNIVTGVSYGKYPSYGGDGYGDGNGYVLRNAGAMCFDYTFPCAGTYRLSFCANNLVNEPGVNPIQAWLAEGAVTNLLGIVKARATNEVEYCFTFRIPEGGTLARSFGFSGTNRGWVDEEGLHSGDAVIDNISLAKVPDADLVDSDAVFPSDAKIAVADRAMLELDFIGTNAVAEVRLGGRKVFNWISAQTHPRYVTGPGVLYVEPKGSLLIVR